MNLGTMRTNIRNLINEPSAGFWTDVQLNSYINMAVERMNSIISTERQDYFTVSATFTALQNVRDYSFPSDCKYIRRMEIYDTADPNNITKIDELKFPRLEANGDWLFTQNGQPQRYIIRATQFAIEPIPDDNYPMRIYYDQIQPALAVDTDVPTGPVDFHDMIVYWAAFLAKKQNQEDDMGFANLFDKRKAEMIETLINRGGEDSVAVESFLEGII